MLHLVELLGLLGLGLVLLEVLQQDRYVAVCVGMLDLDAHTHTHL